MFSKTIFLPCFFNFFRLSKFISIQLGSAVDKVLSWRKKKGKTGK